MTNKSEPLHTLLGHDIRLIQRPDMLCFSLDSVLVADFVNTGKNVRNIVDLGTGFAPIPLFLATKTKTADIVGIELQKDAADLAVRNVELNGLQERIRIIHDDLKSADKHLASDTIDLVTCNPPFYKVDANTPLKDNPQQAYARHELGATFEDIAKQSARMLHPKGRFVFIHRVERLEEILTTLWRYKFAVKRIRFVHPREGKEAMLALFDAMLEGASGMRVLPPLTVHSGSNYSDEVLRIFNRK